MTDPMTTFTERQAALMNRYGSTATSRFLTLPSSGLRTHVLEAGTGTPVLFVHGGNSVAVAWEPLLGGLAKRFHVFAPDRPGCGLTDKVDYRGVDLRKHAVSWLSETMDQLGLQRVSLIGNSMGGYFSLVFSLAYPERVDRLVLVGEPAGSMPRPHLSHQLLAKRGVNALLYATKLKPSPQSIRAGHERLLVRHAERLPEEYWACALAATTLPGAQQSWLTIVEQGITWWGASKLTYALRPELPQLRVPSLFLWGAEDRLGPALRGQEMAALMPQGRAIIVPDAGHLLWLDQPEQTNQAVCEFLQEAATQPRSEPGVAEAATRRV
jgi:pimeloyl-ACP methyl ester carboxylesterase